MYKMAEEQDQPRPTEVTTSPGPGSVVGSVEGGEAERRVTRRTLHEILLEAWQDPEELEFITEPTKIGFSEEFVHDILVVIFRITDLSTLIHRSKNYTSINAIYNMVNLELIKEHRQDMRKLATLGTIHMTYPLQDM